MARFVLDVMLVRKRFLASSSERMSVKSTPLYILDGLDHGQAGEGLFHVDDGIVIGDDRAAADFLRARWRNILSVSSIMPL